jgi:hypothetical protein
MRSFFAAWTTAFEGRPFLNKNNRNTAAMGILAAELPTARFILIRRHPLFVAQSLVEARETVQGDRAVGWGLAAGGPAVGDELADVTDQVQRIEALIERQLSGVDPARVFEVGYDELCDDPQGVVGRISEWLGLVPQRLEALEPFTSNDRPRLEPAEFHRLQVEIGRRFPPA